MAPFVVTQTVIDESWATISDLCNAIGMPLQVAHGFIGTSPQRLSKTTDAIKREIMIRRINDLITVLKYLAHNLAGRRLALDVLDKTSRQLISGYRGIPAEVDPL